MKNSLLFFSIFLLVVTAIAAAITLDKPALQTLLDGWFKDETNKKLADLGLVSLVASIVTPDDEFMVGYGYRDPVNKIQTKLDDLYYIGSISKTFTAISVLQLAEQGKIVLSNAIDQYIDNAPSEIVGDYDSFLRGPKILNSRGITVFDLLTHTGGLDEKLLGLFASNAKSQESLSEFFNPPDQNHLLHGMARRVRQAGTISSYSNTGINMLGYIIEQVSEMTFEQYVQNNILSKIEMINSAPGMNPTIESTFDTKFALPYIQSNGVFVKYPVFFKYGNLNPAGGVMSNIKDMTKYARTLIRKGNYNTTTTAGNLFKLPSTFEYMTTPRFFHRFEGQKNITSIGAVFFLDQKVGQRTFGHDGAIPPYFSDLIVFPDQNFAIVGMVVGANALGFAQYIPALAETIMQGGLDNSTFCPAVTKPELYIRNKKLGTCFETVSMSESFKNMNSEDISQNKLRYSKLEGCYATTRRVHTNYLKTLFNIVQKPIKFYASGDGKHLKLGSGVIFEEILATVMGLPLSIVFERDPKNNPNAFELGSAVTGSNDLIYLPRSEPYPVSFHDKSGNPILPGNNNMASYVRLKMTPVTYERVDCFSYNVSLLAFNFILMISLLCCLCSCCCWCCCCFGDSILSVVISLYSTAKENNGNNNDSETLVDPKMYYKVENQKNHDLADNEPEIENLEKTIAKTKKTMNYKGVALLFGFTIIGLIISAIFMIFGGIPPLIHLIHYPLYVTVLFIINPSKYLIQNDLLTIITFLLPTLSIICYICFCGCGLGLCFVKVITILFGRKLFIAKAIGLFSMFCMFVWTLPMTIGFFTYIYYLADQNALFADHYY